MIYCVEDDSSIRDLMVYTLRAAGLSAEGFADGEAFWQAMQQEIPDFVMLDIMLPGEDGIAILKKLRAAPATAEIPVIMATAKDTEYDRMGMEDKYMEILGNKVICHQIPIRPGRNLAVIVESAAVNYRQKKMGYNAARELYNRVQANLAKRMEQEEDEE